MPDILHISEFRDDRRAARSLRDMLVLRMTGISATPDTSDRDPLNRNVTAVRTPCGSEHSAAAATADQIALLVEARLFSGWRGVPITLGKASLLGIVQPIMAGNSRLQVLSLPEVERAEVAVGELPHERIVAARRPMPLAVRSARK